MQGRKHALQHLIAHTLDTVLINKSRPCSHCSLNGCKTQQIFIMYTLQQGNECIRASTVRIFADSLTHTFLQLCRKKIPQKKLMKLCVFALDHCADHFNADNHGVIFTENGILDCINYGFIAGIDSRCNDIIHIVGNDLSIAI